MLTVDRELADDLAREISAYFDDFTAVRRCIMLWFGRWMNNNRDQKDTELYKAVNTVYEYLWRE